ncbi:hypothetical protein KFK09_006662 [Dendrobium nobile]|uniref:Uncharacterized protein n=1 Tax=Dendrobium nobile TaxID=94219 RepID=A0A8T3BRY7_DENNO|nr:hypothetical protein KFK09_006662 [Dendrobium nobile]
MKRASISSFGVLSPQPREQKAGIQKQEDLNYSQLRLGHEVLNPLAPKPPFFLRLSSVRNKPGSRSASLFSLSVSSSRQDKKSRNPL